MPQGNIKKNYLYHVAFQFLSLIIPLITAPYISRVLLPTGVGLYSYANSIATYFSLMAALGISSYGLREVSRARDDRQKASRLFYELSLLRGASTVVCLLVYLVFVLLFAQDLRVYLACGLVILSAGTDVIRLVPPLVITKEDIDKMAAILGEVLEALA